MSKSNAFAYPPNWPSEPCHPGELKLQDMFGVREEVHRYAPKFIRPYMPDQHRDFYKSLPFLAVAARDEEGRMWSTLLTEPEGEAGFVQSPTSTTLSIRGRPVRGDALENALVPGTDLGILGIEFATKRRNRVNGRVVENGANPQGSPSKSIEFHVDQSFGNCPQYIRPRRWWSAASERSTADSNPHPLPLRSAELSLEQIETIRQSDTLFVASGWRGEGEDPRFGNDSSHRGGAPGWIDVKDSRTIFLPDYSGNNIFNTLGNLQLDSRMGMTIPKFESGGMIQLTGTAVVNFDEEAAAHAYPGAKRVVEFTVDAVVEVPEGSLPVRWAGKDTKNNQRTLQVMEKVKESEDVTSFHFRPADGDDPELWAYRPGQHLPITLNLDPKDETSLLRTYSLSSGPDWGEYRISVKREPFGLASTYLHDEVEVGDKIEVNQPAGDFVLDEGSERTLVFVSTGVGVTPILSMLHAFVQSNPKKKNRKAIWVHGARDGKHHPFKGEVKDLVELAEDSVRTHILYSRPRDGDSEYDRTGRINASLLKDLVPDLEDADVYMCGTGAFMADIEDGLLKLGVDSKHIKFETF